jgi:hypothetical protein
MIKLYPFILPLLVWASIQMLKIIVDSISLRTFHRKRLRGAWWFPSVHSWLTSSIVTIIALTRWIDSLEFMIVSGFSFLFWYDAMHVRYEAGKHAHQINSIRHDLKNVLTIQQWFQMLKERIWHTPLEVIAWIIGGIVLTLWARQFVDLGLIIR